MKIKSVSLKDYSIFRRKIAKNIVPNLVIDRAIIRILFIHILLLVIYVCQNDFNTRSLQFMALERYNFPQNQYSTPSDLF